METVAQLNTALAGRYEIERELGAGGMATVYLARDVRHERHVALKVLRADLGAVLGPERFLSEIRVTANLQHPNLLPLFDSGEAALPGYRAGSGLLFYVMPYVEGESLRARLLREKQLPVDEAVRMAVAVAGALDYAHAHGVIHRDLKPENILIQAGQPVVADFGIALAVSKAGGSRVTQTGISLGTPHYMSPEQATGDRAIDGRADIYALGAVLYEMLTGDPPHTGASAQAIIARVLTETPRSPRSVRPNVPPHVEAAVMRALEKLPADRFATAREFADALQNPGAVSAARRTDDRAPGRASRGRPRLWLAAAATAGVLLGATVTGWWSSATELTSSARAPVLRTTINLPREAPLVVGNVPSSGYNRPTIAISPDGAWLAYVAKTASGAMLVVRDMANGEARVVAGTEGAIHPFFSPDGQWIGFLTSDHVKKVPRHGGGVTTLCEARDPALARWVAGNLIYFTEPETFGLSRVSADGGKAEVVVSPHAKLTPFWSRFTDVLPDGRSALVSHSNGIGGDYGDVSRIDLRTREMTTLIRAGYGASYVPAGYLLFARAGAVMAVRYDAARDVIGDPIVLASGVATESLFGILHAASSANGVLAYAPYGDLSVGKLAWTDRRGNVSYLDVAERVYGVVDAAPDANRIAVHVAGVTDYVWIWDSRRREGRRIPTQTAAGWPRWSRDGSRLAISEIPGSQSSVDVIDVRAGAGDAPVWRGRQAGGTVYDWSPRDDVLALTASHGRVRFLGVNKTLDAPEYEGLFPTFSPDGRWVAYLSRQTGQNQVFIRSFPDGRLVGQVSTGAGLEPRWKPSGDLYYRAGQQWYVTHVSTTPTPRWDPPRPVFNTDFIDTPGVSYDVSSDGQRLLVVKRARPLDTSRIELVTNWFQLVSGRN